MSSQLDPAETPEAFPRESRLWPKAAVASASVVSCGRCVFRHRRRGGSAGTSTQKTAEKPWLLVRLPSRAQEARGGPTTLGVAPILHPATVTDLEHKRNLVLRAIGAGRVDDRLRLTPAWFAPTEAPKESLPITPRFGPGPGTATRPASIITRRGGAWGFGVLHPKPRRGGETGADPIGDLRSDHPPCLDLAYQSAKRPLC